MSELAEDFQLMKEEAKKRKAENARIGFQRLHESRFDYRELSPGHYRVEDVADYWPSTGTWIFCNQSVRGRGIKKLLRELERRIPNE